MLLVLTASLFGCNGGDKLLQELEGNWAGDALVDADTYMVTANFEYTDFFKGQVTIAEPTGNQTYAVRRSESFSRHIGLDLLGIEDVTRSLTIDGELDETSSFVGNITVTLACPGDDICGWSGQFNFTRSAPQPDTAAPSEPGAVPNDTGL